LKKRLGFVCNSSSSDFILDGETAGDCDNCERLSKNDVRDVINIVFKELESEGEVGKFALNKCKESLLTYIKTF
jgi:hypothetical protein